MGHLSLGGEEVGEEGEEKEREYITIYADQVISENNMQREETDRQTDRQTDRDATMKTNNFLNEDKC